jgi:Fe-S cluster biogenesis protein NfuA
MIRSLLKRGLKRVLGIDDRPARSWESSQRSTPPPEMPEAPVAQTHVTGSATSTEGRESMQDPSRSARPLTFETVREVLDEQVRPALQADGGDIELLGLEDGRARVHLTGACYGCASSSITLKMGVEMLLKEEFPDLVEIVAEE